MNWRLGLHRVSAVVFGVISAMIVGFGVVVAQSYTTSDWAEVGMRMISMVSLGIGLCYVAHRLVCWIISGFFRQT